MFMWTQWAAQVVLSRAELDWHRGAPGGERSVKRLGAHPGICSNPSLKVNAPVSDDAVDCCKAFDRKN
jgi:hypothetical protein